MHPFTVSYVLLITDPTLYWPLFLLSSCQQVVGYSGTNENKGTFFCDIYIFFLAQNLGYLTSYHNNGWSLLFQTEKMK
jgi:hypothetical protein